jgi:hypothetical protein
MKKLDESRAQVQAAFLEVVDNQIRDNNPPETKQTLDRLIREGHSEDQARKLIAVVVGVEISEMLKQKKPFDMVRFAVALKQLPKLSVVE